MLNALLRKDRSYDLHKDFVPVTNIGVGQGYLLVVRQDLPVHSVGELVAFAKKRGDKRLTYGTPGIGTPTATRVCWRTIDLGRRDSSWRGHASG